MIKVIERLHRGMCSACWQREDLPQSMQIKLFEILKKLLSQCRLDTFAVIQKLAPAGRALKTRVSFLDFARSAVDRWEKPAIGLEMVEPGSSADFFRIRIRLLHVGKHCFQLLPSCINLGTAERAEPVVISVREVNAHHAVLIRRIATKASKLPLTWRQAFRWRLREEGLRPYQSLFVRLKRHQLFRLYFPLRCDGRSRDLTKNGPSGWGMAPSRSPPKAGDRGNTDRRVARPWACSAAAGRWRRPTPAGQPSRAPGETTGAGPLYGPGPCLTGAGATRPSSWPRLAMHQGAARARGPREGARSPRATTGRVPSPRRRREHRQTGIGPARLVGTWTQTGSPRPRPHTGVASTNTRP
jgi:hypothetical protein